MTFGDQSRASLERSFEELNRRTGWDCTVSAFDGWRLQISSGTSEETQQPLVSFCGVSYLSCPMEFSHPTFRLASREEVERVQEAIPLVTDDKVIAIDAETMSGLARQVFFVVAQAIELGVFQP